MSQSPNAAAARGARPVAVVATEGPRTRCVVQTLPGRAPYLSFTPAEAQGACATASLVALHLRAGVTPGEAQALADHLNRLLDDVSATVLHTFAKAPS